MSEIQTKIREYLAGKSTPPVFTLRCFVGMLETGEATYGDFQAVGGDLLVAEVAKAKENIEGGRE